MFRMNWKRKESGAVAEKLLSIANDPNGIYREGQHWLTEEPENILTV